MILETYRELMDSKEEVYEIFAMVQFQKFCQVFLLTICRTMTLKNMPKERQTSHLRINIDQIQVEAETKTCNT
jgi:hypothetical protein